MVQSIFTLLLTKSYLIGVACTLIIKMFVKIFARNKEVTSRTTVVDELQSQMFAAVNMNMALMKLN